MTARRFLLTGASGFLGLEVLYRLLSAGNEVLALSRRRGEESPSKLQHRFVTALRLIDREVPTQGLQTGFGDLEAPGLGLTLESKTWLRAWGSPVQIIHAAAQTSFELPLESMLLTNLEGTKRVIELARDLHRRDLLIRLDHVSTAFVAGDRLGLVREGDLDLGQKPRNPYEASKLASEIEVEKAKHEGLPVTVYRPSIIVGDSRSGRATSFSALYWPLREYWRGRIPVAIGRRDCVVDAVPVDFVAAAIAELATRDSATGETYHLAAGPERQATLAEIVEIARGHVGGKALRWVDPARVSWALEVPGLAREVAKVGGLFVPYLISNPSFCVERSSAALAATGLVPPPVSRCFDVAAGYAIDHEFAVPGTS